MTKELHQLHTATQARAARVLHTYASPSERKEAVLQRDRERVLAFISRKHDVEMISESNEPNEVTYYCTGCLSTIGPDQKVWHRIHGRITEIG